MKRLVSLIVCVCLVLVTISGCSNINNEKQNAQVSLLLDWEPNTNHTGIFVAQELGFFEEEGLTVNIEQAPENGVVPLVGSGSADFGIDFQDYMAPAIENDIPVTAIASLLGHNTSGIISLKDKNILSPKDLENKDYATINLPVEQAMIKSMVERDGGDFSKVTLKPSTALDAISALQTDVDAVWVFYAQDVISAQQKGVDTNFFYIKDAEPEFDYYTPVIVGNNEFIQNEKETTQAFLRALKKGYLYAINNPNDAADIMLKSHTGLDSDMVHRSQEWIADRYITEGEDWGYISPERWNGFYKWLYKNNLIEKDISDNLGFTNEYLPKD